VLWREEGSRKYSYYCRRRKVSSLRMETKEIFTDRVACGFLAALPPSLSLYKCSNEAPQTTLPRHDLDMYFQ